MGGLGHPPVVIIGVHDHRQPDLMEIRRALCLARLGAGCGQGRQQQRGQNGDDGDHHQQLD